MASKSITGPLLAMTAVLMLAGCSQLGYYAQATRGQLSLLGKRQPVAELLTDEQLSARLRQQLLLAQAIRQFGLERLGLQDNNTYTQYADLGRRHALWNVVAAPRLSVVPKTWCFPIAGCVSYRGYFREEGAQRHAALTAAEGFDTFVYGVNAYSTLGWFDDPLLNTFIYFREPALAALIFHELTHQVVYFKDDSAFNEAFATAVEYYLLEQWLRVQQKTDVLADVVQRRDKHHRITALVLDYREQLASLYESDLPDEVKLSRKESLFAELKARYQHDAQEGYGTPYYDWWFEQPLNNALLLTVSTYFQLVPAITALLDQSDGDLLTFIAAVKKQGPGILVKD